jgi:hypothetical protein
LVPCFAVEVNFALLSFISIACYLKVVLMYHCFDCFVVLLFLFDDRVVTYKDLDVCVHLSNPYLQHIIIPMCCVNIHYNFEVP